MFNYLIWGLTAALYSPIIYQLYRNRWEMIDYTHAYFILPVSLWLVWRKRNELRKAKKKPSAAGLPLLILGILLFVFGWRWEYLLISTFSLILTTSGLALYLYGSKTAKLLKFPILYLLLMVPPPLGILDSITLPMRYGISAAAEFILRSFHVPVVRDGLLLNVGGQEIFMGQPCSGFRSLITLISLGLAYVHICKSSQRTKTILLASILPLALTGNLIRVLSLCLVTYHFGPEIGQGFFHDFSGIIMFIVTISGLIGLEAYLNRPRVTEEES
jgi:exosortase